MKPIPDDSYELLRRLSRDVENLKRHSHSTPQAEIGPGTITTEMFAANAIPVTILADGDLSASVKLSGTITAETPGGGKLTYSSAGQTLLNADGETWFLLPTDPEKNPFMEGDFIAKSLLVEDGFSMRGSGIIEQGAELRLSDGISAPTSAPTATVVHEQYDGGLSVWLFNTRGFHHESDGGDRYGAMAFFSITRFIGPAGRYRDLPEVLDAEGDPHSQWYPHDMTVVWDGSKKTVISVGQLHANGEAEAPEVSLQAFDYSSMSSDGSTDPGWGPMLGDGTFANAWYSAHKVGRCIGTGLGNQVVYAYRELYGSSVDVRRFLVADSSITQIGIDSIQLTPPWATDEGITGIVYGDSATMDFPGPAQNIYLVCGSVNVYAFDEDGDRLPEFDFPSFGNPAYFDAMGATGATHTFGGFRSAPFYQANEGEPRWVTKYTDMHWEDTESSRWWVSSTWVDTVGTPHESAQSPRAVVTMAKRGALLVTIPPYPAHSDPVDDDDVNAARVYLSRGATDPGRTYMEQVAALAEPTRTFTVTSHTFPAGTAAVPPPAVSNFPTTAPARFTSADGTSFVLAGDGTVVLTDPELLGTTTAEDLDVTNDIVVGGNLIIEGGEVTYPQAEIMVDGSVEIQTAGSLPGSTDRSVYQDRWSVWEVSGSGSAWITATGAAHDGGQVLSLISGGGYQRATSEHFDVEPGVTYVARFRAGKLGSGTARLYMRMAGGSDDNLTEYPGNSSSSGLQPNGTLENVDVPSLGANAGAANPALYQEYSFAFTVPAGVTRAAWSAVNFQTTGTVEVWLDSFEITPVRNEGDTDWVNCTLVNTGGWSAGGGIVPAFRVKSGIIFFRGNIQSFPSGSWYQVVTIPSGLCPAITANFPGGLGTNVNTAFIVNSNGAVSAYCASTTTAWLSMSGISYPLDL